MNSRYLVPIVGMVVVAGITFLLLVITIVKPFAGPNTSWETHFNSVDAPPEGYSRNIPTFVSAAGDDAIQIWAGKGCGFNDGITAAGCDLTPEQSWVVYGCAGCHGLSGEGTSVGPDLVAFTGDDFDKRVRFGPDGMIGFHDVDLSDEHLALIVEYLTGRQLVVYGGPPPTPVPPTPTPTKVPATPTPTVVSTVVSTQPAGTTPTATPTNSEFDSELLAQGKEIYDVTAGDFGCDYCHGPLGKGGGEDGNTAPDIQGATRSAVRDALKSAFDMEDIKMTSDEIDAVVEYLKFLQQQ